MKKIITYRLAILFIFSTLMVISSCRRNRIESLPPYTDLKVKIKDQNGNLLDGVNVAVFASEDDFNASINNDYDFSNAIGVGVARDGKVDLDSLPSRNDYWILAYYPNNTLFNGFTIMFDNSEQTNKIPFRPSDKSIIDLSIILKPAEGLVTFWSSSASISTNPARVVSGENSIKNTALVNQSSPSVPSPSPVYTLKKRKGTYNYYAIANQFCTWTGNYTISLGNVVNVELGPCSAGSITLFSSTNAQLFPLEITIGQGAKKDTIFSPSNGSCGLNNLNVKTFSLPPGNYSYFVKSLNPNITLGNSCVWSDRFVITEGNCIQIDLPLCK